jgi:hypothetical protein
VAIQVVGLGSQVVLTLQIAGVDSTAAKGLRPAILAIEALASRKDKAVIRSQACVHAVDQEGLQPVALKVSVYFVARHDELDALANEGLEVGNRGGIRKDILDELKAIVPETTLNKPISSLDLSVRARKALQLLNINTVGELASRTEAELMGVKNFGATSLHEIRERLGQHGLTLRQLS